MQSLGAKPAKNQTLIQGPTAESVPKVSRPRFLTAMNQGRSLLTEFVICMRPHQWVKNLFVLAPILFGRKLDDPWAIGRTLVACGAFCLLSSALYIFNDVIDAEADRAHKEKRHRPIASGALPVSLALLGSSILFLMAAVVAATLGAAFLLLAASYFSLMLLYCVVLKRSIVIDCMVIASGFVVRVVSGAVVVGVKPSHWLIVCAFLLALYLAFAKRRQELLTLSAAALSHRQVFAEYKLGYLNQVNDILLGATIVCYMLYTVAPETIAYFGTDSLIYGAVFVIYGLLRYMALIQNPANGGEPSKLLVSDRPLVLAILCWGLFNALVIYHSSFASFWQRLP